MVSEFQSSNIKRFNRVTMLACLVLAAAILIQPVGAFANDTLVRIGAGGITFIKSEDIRMLEEVLHISQKQVRVKYRFLNESDKDIHATVAYPLPASKEKSAEELQRFMEPFKRSFAVLINGSRVSTTTDHSEAIVWQQSFPAGKETLVEHRYVPIPGGDTDIVPYERDSDLVSRIRDRVLFHVFFSLMLDGCVDRGTRRTIQSQATSLLAEGRHVYLVERHVEYILGTGRNWKGPIGKFTLRIEKGAPEDFISLCFPGKAKEVSPTMLEFVENDFVPPDKLVVYFYTLTVTP